MLDDEIQALIRKFKARDKEAGISSFVRLLDWRERCELFVACLDITEVVVRVTDTTINDHCVAEYLMRDTFPEYHQIGGYRFQPPPNNGITPGFKNLIVISKDFRMVSAIGTRKSDDMMALEGEMAQLEAKLKEMKSQHHKIASRPVMNKIYEKKLKDYHDPHD